MPKKSTPVAERLSARTDLLGPDDCHFFTGFVTSNGYGRLPVPGRTSLGAHVAAWEIVHGPVPPGMVVCHTCDVRYAPGDTTYRRCVNVAHLRLGTQADNLRWMRQHGRANPGPDGPRAPQQVRRKPKRPGTHGPEPRPVAERFWEKVDRSGGFFACWPWRGGFANRRGYGQFSMGTGKPRRAHRVAWELTNGPIPPGLVVMHVCDSPSCCNWTHLALGTVAQNNADRARKGRSASGDAHWTRRQPERLAQYSRFGSDNPMAKLTEDEVREIRRAHAAGAATGLIAEWYGVSASLVSAISHRRIWKHVP